MNCSIRLLLTVWMLARWHERTSRHQAPPMTAPIAVAV